MGRTNATYRMILRDIEQRWGTYRRALRKPDQPHYDRLLEHAREHADAASYRNHEEPLFAILLSIALEHEKALASLGDRVATLEARLDEQAES